MYRLIVLPILLLCAITSYADTFDLPLRLHHGKQLFDARRYRDAELVLEQVRADYQPVNKQALDSYLTVLDFLARSISQQGKIERVRDLLQERHILIARHHDTRGYVYANSMSRLAEAYYREGNRQRAMNFADHALSLYHKLNPAPNKAIELVSKNKAQYKINAFSTSMLPMDLSDFYTRCEQLKSSTTLSHEVVNAIFSDYVEVGVDYSPRGAWADFFDTVTAQQKVKYGNKAEFRFFIPHRAEPMRDELCIIADSNPTVTSAESTLD